MQALLCSISSRDLSSRSPFSFGSPIWPVAPPIRR